MDQENGQTDIIVRSLNIDDLARLVRIDKAITGRGRPAWYEKRLKAVLEDSDIQISLGAEQDGVMIGAMLGSVHFGEYGIPEPLAVLDTVLVDPSSSRRGVASALFHQLAHNLRGLRIERLRTEVAWDDHELIGFLASKGFRPIPRMVLETDVSSLTTTDLP